MEDILLVLTKR